MEIEETKKNINFEVKIKLSTEDQPNQQAENVEKKEVKNSEKETELALENVKLKYRIKHLERNLREQLEQKVILFLVITVGKFILGS